MAITKEQLFAAADALEANGEAPSLDSVREALGVTTTRLTDVMSETEAMNAWKARKAAKTQLLREPTPPVVAERVTEFGNELWVVALELADERLAPERKALDAARAELEAKTQAAQFEATELRSQLIAANERNAAALARADEFEKRVADLKAELVRVNEQNQELVVAIKAAVGIASEK